MAAMFNDISTPLTHLATRRSGKPRDMVAPGPDAAQLAGMLALAARTPDHGKLAPWRFVVVPADRRDAFAAMLLAAYRVDRPEAKAIEIAAIEEFAHTAPTLVIVLSAPRGDSHIPAWEQELSAGAATMNLLHAAHAMGFVAGWLTGWAAFSEQVHAAVAMPGERIAGFVFIGTPSRPLEERPRPDMAALVRNWDG